MIERNLTPHQVCSQLSSQIAIIDVLPVTGPISVEFHALAVVVSHVVRNALDYHLSKLRISFVSSYRAYIYQICNLLPKMTFWVNFGKLFDILSNLQLCLILLLSLCLLPSSWTKCLLHFMVICGIVKWEILSHPLKNIRACSINAHHFRGPDEDNLIFCQV